MLGVNGAEAVVVLPFTFVTPLIIESNPTFLTQTSNSYVIRFKNPRPSKILLSNWYRPPNSPIELSDKFEVLLGKMEAENIESNILGDRVPQLMKSDILSSSVNRLNILN